MSSKQVTDYEKDRDQAAYKHWGEYKDYELIPYKSIDPEFRDFCYGADWGKKWCEEKGTGNLIEFMKNTERARIKQLEDFCDRAVSFIKNKTHVAHQDFFDEKQEILDFWYGTITPPTTGQERSSAETQD